VSHQPAAAGSTRHDSLDERETSVLRLRRSTSGRRAGQWYERNQIEQTAARPVRSRQANSWKWLNLRRVIGCGNRPSSTKPASLPQRSSEERPVGETTNAMISGPLLRGRLESSAASRLSGSVGKHRAGLEPVAGLVGAQLDQDRHAPRAAAAMAYEERIEVQYASTMSHRKPRPADRSWIPMTQRFGGEDRHGRLTDPGPFRGVPRTSSRWREAPSTIRNSTRSAWSKMPLTGLQPGRSAGKASRAVGKTQDSIDLIRGWELGASGLRLAGTSAGGLARGRPSPRRAVGGLASDGLVSGRLGVGLVVSGGWYRGGLLGGRHTMRPARLSRALLAAWRPAARTTPAAACASACRSPSGRPEAAHLHGGGGQAGP